MPSIFLGENFSARVFFFVFFFFLVHNMKFRLTPPSCCILRVTESRLAFLQAHDIASYLAKLDEKLSFYLLSLM